MRHHEVFEDRRWLGGISYAGGSMSYPDVTHDKAKVPNYKETLLLAADTFAIAAKVGLLFCLLKLC